MLLANHCTQRWSPHFWDEVIKEYTMQAMHCIHLAIVAMLLHKALFWQHKTVNQELFEKHQDKTSNVLTKNSMLLTLNSLLLKRRHYSNSTSKLPTHSFKSTKMQSSPSDKGFKLTIYVFPFLHMWKLCKLCKKSSQKWTFFMHYLLILEASWKI